MFLFLYMNPILIAAAVIPAIVLLVQVYRADRLEPEPPVLLLSLVLYGIFATGLAMLTEELGSALLDRSFPRSSTAYNVLMYFVVVAFSEEGFKYLLLKKRTWRSPAFNCQFDGVVYAVFVSLGFALWENISYVLTYGFSTALVRAVTAVPGHAYFGVFMGIFYGIAKRHENRGNHRAAVVYQVFSVAVPVVMHGAYDYIASMEQLNSGWVFVAFIAVMFFIAFRLVGRASEDDRYIG